MPSINILLYCVSKFRGFSWYYSFAKEIAFQQIVILRQRFADQRRQCTLQELLGFHAHTIHHNPRHILVLSS